MIPSRRLRCPAKHVLESAMVDDDDDADNEEEEAEEEEDAAKDDDDGDGDGSLPSAIICDKTSVMGPRRRLITNLWNNWRRRAPTRTYTFGDDPSHPTTAASEAAGTQQKSSFSLCSRTIALALPLPLLPTLPLMLPPSPLLPPLLPH